MRIPLLLMLLGGWAVVLIFTLPTVLSRRRRILAERAKPVSGVETVRLDEGSNFIREIGLKEAAG
jgi:hypothetical protein